MMNEIPQPNDLDIQLHETFLELGIPQDIETGVMALLKPLKEKSPAHHEAYNHSIRVGLLAKRIASVMHLDSKAVFFAGIFHDLGKQEIDANLLGKTEAWTTEDRQRIQQHVITGYELLKGKFDFSAETLLRHHLFQHNGYPELLPEYLHQYSKGTKILIDENARVLALADVYDALHRENSFFGEKKRLTDTEIESSMLLLNPDRRQLIEGLYRLEILRNADKTRETESQQRLYQEAVAGGFQRRTPFETRRQVQLAAALEPVSDKTENTTRYANASRFLKLEYFIAAGINLGDSMEALAQRIDATHGQPHQMYDLAVQSQLDSIKNRAGGRVNQGIIEILFPIVASQHLYNADNTKSVDEVLKNAVEILRCTSVKDVNQLRKMKKLAFELSNYTDRVVPEHPEVSNVLDYYKEDLTDSSNPTSFAHNSEFVNGFPTVRIVYDALNNARPDKDRFAEIIEDAYRHALAAHDSRVGRGFIADCVAAGIYLYISQNPKAKFIK